MSVPFRFLAAAALAIVPVPAPAQSSTPMPVPHLAFPGDRVVVPLRGGGTCNAAVPDRARPPRIRLLARFGGEVPSEQDAYRYRVRYDLHDDPHRLCGTPPPPPTWLADVGALPPGVHVFEVEGRLDGTPLAAYTTGMSWVAEHAGIPPDATGLWYDPAQSGLGLSVTRIDHDSLALLWFTLEPRSGAPFWVASAADNPSLAARRAYGLAHTTRGLRAGPADVVPASEPWGALTFTYVGCGRARLQWDPLDPTWPNGSRELVKLAQSDREERCAPIADAVAVWE